MDLIEAIDGAVLDFVAGHRTGLVTSAARAAMFLGSGGSLYTIVTLGAAYLLARRRWRLVLPLAVSLSATIAATAILKPLIARPRPPQLLAIVDVPGYAMPSGTAAATAAAGWLLWSAVSYRSATHRSLSGVAIAAGTVGTGFFMVYLGAHWPTDVVAGWIIGVSLGALAKRSVGALPDEGEHPTGYPLGPTRR